MYKICIIQFKYLTPDLPCPKFPFPSPLSSLVLILLLSLGLNAQTVTWTGASDNSWTNDSSDNWTGLYEDGINVIFNDTGANTDPIALSGTITPGSILFNADTLTYTLQGGTLAGGGLLTQSGNGTVNFTLAGTNAMSISTYTGNVEILGGLLNARAVGTTNAAANLSLGTGGVLIDNNAILQLTAFSGTNNAIAVTFDNAITVGSAGAEIHLVAPQWMRAGAALNGGIALEGDLVLSLQATANFRDVLIPTLDVVGNRQLMIDTQIVTYNSASPVIINTVTSDGTGTLTIDGTSPTNTTVNITNSVNLANLNIASGVTTIAFSTPGAANTSGASTSVDVLAGLRANEGKVNVAEGVTVEWGAGNWTISDFNLGGNNALIFSNSTQNQTVYLTENLTVGGASPITGVTWTLGQNPWIGSDTGISMIIDDGGVFTMNVNNTQARSSRLAIRVYDGGVLDMHYTGTIDSNTQAIHSFSSNGSGLYFGNGDVMTNSLVTIQGITQATQQYVQRINVGSGTDDGNVTLRYATRVFDAPIADYFNIGWINGNNLANMLAFREGSAGTIFAPDVNTAGIAAVGPETGTVFTATQNILMETTGTVGFYNATTSGNRIVRGSLGHVILDEMDVTFLALGLFEVGSIHFAGANTITLSGAADMVGLEGTVLFSVAGVNPGSVTGDLPSVISSYGYILSIGGDGNDLILAIPEPGTYALILGALSMAMVLFIRRRSSRVAS